MQKNKWRCLLPAMLFASGVVSAGTELPPAPNSLKPVAPTAVPVPVAAVDSGSRDTSLGRLEDIQAKTLLYEAQLAQAKAFNELQKNGYDAVLGGPFNPQPTTPVKDKTEAPLAQESKAPPQIVEISGGQQLSATLLLEGGNQIRVQAGSRIPGTSWTVAKITFSEVTVSTSNGSPISLAFAG